MRVEVRDTVESVVRPKAEARVYCTYCQHFDGLVKTTIEMSGEIPSPCSGCYPYNFEDCVPRHERPNYEPISGVAVGL